MKQHVLITGGGGFIGSHVADELLKHGYRVRAIDILTPQVHGSHTARPTYLDPDVEFVLGDLRDREVLDRSLEGIDAVCHLAASVGVGQSMYQIEHYMDTNAIGTSVLLEALIKKRVAKLLVASSMSIYGEGLYRSADGQFRTPSERPMEQLQANRWEFHGSDGTLLEPVPTNEDVPPALSSVYALSKYVQERMCLLVGRAYQLPAVALRFFNVYGPRQALSNPYTGVLAIFAARLLNDNPPMIFEDGEQKRDFVSVYDVARACRLALETPQAEQRVFNIASGRAVTIRQVAEKMARLMGHGDFEPRITGKYRAGDVRHCFADITAARQMLGYEPAVTFKAGLADLARWLEGQLADDRVEAASAELAARGLTL